MLDEHILENLEEIKAILKISAREEFQKIRFKIITTSNKEKIYELCTGTNEMSEISKKVNISAEGVRLTIRDFENAGIIITRKKGGKAYPKRVL